MTNPIVIVADDLTGAIDSAAPFAARGARVRIALHVDAIAEVAAGDPQVLSVDTRSRDLPASEAVERIAAAWHALAPLAPALVMKKIDSRLQGECAVEAGHLLALSGRELAVICPAVPDQHRIVTGGWLSGRGLAHPVAVADRFAAINCTCPDAGDADDLTAIAAGILADPPRIMAVGAAGLATAIADRRFGPSRPAAATPLELPMLIAIGSRDAITDAQVDHLRRDHPAVDQPAGAIRLHHMPQNPLPDAAQALARFAEGVAHQVESVGMRTLLCSGGDTAAAMMDALGVRQLQPEGEWDVGIPLARVTGRPALRLLTKSGGFGDAAVLSRIAADARSSQRRDAA